jgi:hypothetical protein
MTERTLLDELRELATYQCAGYAYAIDAAADRIEALESTNARLVAALVSIKREADSVPECGSVRAILREALASGGEKGGAG